MRNIFRRLQNVKYKLATIAVLSFVLFAFGDDFSSWAITKKVAINTTASGANISTDLYGYPLLITLNSTNFDFSKALPNGADLRFTKSNETTALPYEIEEWNSAQSRARVWVRVDTIKGNNNSQYILMYWGKSGVNSIASPPNVFAPSAVAVWHMNNDPSGTPPQLKDITSFGNNGYSNGLNANNLIDGLIGKSVQFNGFEKFAVPDTGSMKLPGDFTISFWVKKAVTQNIAFAKMLHKGNHNKNPFGSYMFQTYQDTLSDSISMQVGYIDSTNGKVSGKLLSNTWCQVAGTFTGGSLNLYIDGNLSQSKSSSGKTIIQTTDSIGIGGQGQKTSTSAYFKGALDEVRIETVGRSADWIKMNFQTQKSGANCITIDNPPPKAPIITTEPRDSLVGEGMNVSFSVNSTGTEPKTYKWFKNNVQIANATQSVLTITNVQAIDSGSTFYCIISNVAGFDTSRLAKLVVYKKPTISQQPLNTTCTEGESVTFSVVATGPALSYKWVLNNRDTIGNSNKLVLSTTSMQDSNAVYKCFVSNLAGIVVTNNVTLTVVRFVGAFVTLEPKSDTIVEGRYIVFKTAASGTAPIAYSWYKKGDATKLSSSDSLAFPQVKISQNGYQYFCIVTNGRGSFDTTQVITLTVLPATKPTITSESMGTIVRERQSFSLKIIAAGTAPLQYRWMKNGTIEVGSNASLVFQNIQKSDSGIYTCIVKNDEGADTSSPIKITVFGLNETWNPIVVKSSFVDQSHIRCKVFGYTNLPMSYDQNYPTASYTDTIGLWYRNGDFPISLSSASPNLIKFSLQNLKISLKDSIDTVITVPQISQDCYNYYIGGSVIWEVPKTIPPLVPQNSSVIYMCDTAHFQNNLVLSGSYQTGTQNFNLQIRNLPSLDRSKVKYLIVWYTIENGLTEYDTIQISNLPVGSEFTKTYSNFLFKGEQKSISFKILQRGIYGAYSDTVTAAFTVGTPRIINNFTLTNTKTTASTISLSWNSIPESTYDSLRIWLGTNQIPLQYDIPISQFTPLYMSKDLTTFTIKGLKELTTYHFGLQVCYQGLWSYITDKSRLTIATTQIVDTSIIKNQLKITSCTYDSTSQKIVFKLYVDSTSLSSLLPLQAGVVWSYDSLPIGEPSPPLKSKIFEISKLNDTLSYSLDLQPDLRFGKTCYFSIWLGKDDLKWSNPTTQSQISIKIPISSWQIVSYFEDLDSISAFSGKIKLWKDVWPSQIGKISDTVTMFVPTSSPKGLVEQSFAFKFRLSSNSPKINIGIHYDSVQKSFKESDIRMYYIDNAENWKVFHKFKIDTTTNMVWITERPFDYPFPLIIGIDTLPPIISVQTDTVAFVNTHIPVVDSISVDDNISNVQLSLYCAKGGDTLSLVKQSFLKDYKEKVVTNISDLFVSDDYGFRALLVVNDGCNIDTLDLSRSVKRESSDQVYIPPMQWYPLRATANILKPTIPNALDEFGVDSTWVYDTKKFRIFRWVTTNENRSKSNKWVEYANTQSVEPLFSFEPGRIVWIKSSEAMYVNLGSAYTTSLKEPFQMVLKAKEWTDFGLPFRFRVHLKDLLKYTNDGQERPDLLFYKWTLDTIKKRFFTDGLFLPKITNLNDSNVFFHSDPQSAYSVFNNSNLDVILKIPTYVSQENVNFFPKKRISPDWNIKIDAYCSNERVSPVYCGTFPLEKESFFLPVPPSLGAVSIYLQNTTDGSVWGGQVVNNKNLINGQVFDLLFVNYSDEEQKVTPNIKGYNFENSNKIYRLYDQINRKLYDNSIFPQFTLKAKESYSFKLLVGDQNFINQYISGTKNYAFKIHSIYPNPSHGQFNIKLDLPFEINNNMEIALFNQLGKLIWKKQNLGFFRAGTVNIKIAPDIPSTRSAAGNYLIRVTLKGSKNNNPKHVYYPVLFVY